MPSLALAAGSVENTLQSRQRKRRRRDNQFPLDPSDSPTASPVPAVLSPAVLSVVELSLESAAVRRRELFVQGSVALAPLLSGYP